MNNFCELLFPFWREPAKAAELALSYGPREYTHLQLSQRVSAIARTLKAGERYLPGDSDLDAALTMALGCMHAGAVAVFPPAGLSPWALGALLQKQKINAFICTKPPKMILRLISLLSGRPILRVNLDEKAPLMAPSSPPGEGLALVSYSSGSTGNPTPKYRSHASLIAQHLAIKKAFPPYSGQRDSPLFPNVLLHNLAVGVPTFLSPAAGKNLLEFEPEQAWHWLIEKRITSLTANRYFIERLHFWAQSLRKQAPELRDVGLGGSPIPEKSLAAARALFPNARIFVIYGATEAEPIALREWKESYPPEAGYAVGKPVEEIELRLDDCQSVRSPWGPKQAGAISLRGVHVNAPKGQWLATGDYGYLHEDQLFLTGRAGNHQVHDGWMHYQLEHALINHPAIEQAAAIAREDSFQLYYQGALDLASCRSLLPPDCAGLKISKGRQLPVDPRHFSKVLYRKL